MYVRPTPPNPGNPLSIHSGCVKYLSTVISLSLTTHVHKMQLHVGGGGVVTSSRVFFYVCDYNRFAEIFHSNYSIAYHAHYYYIIANCAWTITYTWLTIDTKHVGLRIALYTQLILTWPKDGLNCVYRTLYDNTYIPSVECRITKYFIK